jgi:hypothetical protein
MRISDTSPPTGFQSPRFPASAKRSLATIRNLAFLELLSLHYREHALVCIQLDTQVKRILTDLALTAVIYISLPDQCSFIGQKPRQEESP